VLLFNFYEDRYRSLLFHIVSFLLESGESEQFLKKIVDDRKISMMELWYLLGIKYWKNISVQPLPTVIQTDQLMNPNEKCFHFFMKKNQDYLIHLELMKIGHDIPMLNYMNYTKKKVLECNLSSIYSLTKVYLQVNTIGEHRGLVQENPVKILERMEKNLDSFYNTVLKNGFLMKHFLVPSEWLCLAGEENPLFVAVKYEDHWYRAKIYSYNWFSQKVKIIFCDYGDEMIFAPDELFLLHNAFKTFPVQGIRAEFSFDHVRQISPDGVKLALMNVTKDVTCRLRIDEITVGKVRVSKLFIPISNAGGIDFEYLIKEKGLAK